MRLGERLREIRREHSLTLKDLSQKAGLSIPYLSNVERGEVNPSFDALKKVAVAYNMAVKDLLTGVDKPDYSIIESYPQGFKELLDNYTEINEDWKDLLLQISLRGKRPSSERDWVELYLHLRRILEPEKE